jgi:hypothetical protein
VYLVVPISEAAFPEAHVFGYAYIRVVPISEMPGGQEATAIYRDRATSGSFLGYYHRVQLRNRVPSGLARLGGTTGHSENPAWLAVR